MIASRVSRVLSVVALLCATSQYASSAFAADQGDADQAFYDAGQSHDTADAQWDQAYLDLCNADQVYQDTDYYRHNTWTGGTPAQEDAVDDALYAALQDLNAAEENFGLATSKFNDAEDHMVGASAAYANQNWASVVSLCDAAIVDYVACFNNSVYCTTNAGYCQVHCAMAAAIMGMP